MTSHSSDKRLSDEVEAAVHHAVKAESQHHHHDAHHVDQNDMPVPPPDSVEFEKETEI